MRIKQSAKSVALGTPYVNLLRRAFESPSDAREVLRLHNLPTEELRGIFKVHTGAGWVVLDVMVALHQWASSNSETPQAIEFRTELEGDKVRRNRLPQTWGPPKLKH